MNTPNTREQVERLAALTGIDLDGYIGSPKAKANVTFLDKIQVLENTILRLDGELVAARKNSSVAAAKEKTAEPRAVEVAPKIAEKQEVGAATASDTDKNMTITSERVGYDHALNDALESVAESYRKKYNIK